MKEKVVQTIAVDFDNTICQTKGKTLGEPIEGAEEALDDLSRAGFRIIIHSTRANTVLGRAIIANWLDKYDIEYAEIVGKPEADYYVDDKAIEFTNWANVSARFDVE